MRRVALAFVCLLVVATPAFGDDVTKKQEIDAKISSLQGKLAAQQRREKALRGQVADYTSRIRSLEARVGDVSLKLQTLEADLALHQKRLDALNELYSIQTKKFRFLKAQYTASITALNARLVDIYESDQATSIDIFLGAQNVQDAIDQVQYMNEIGEQDRRIAAQVARAKADVKRQRAQTKKVRTRVQGETKVISARTSQTRYVRDQLVGAKNDLNSTKHDTLVALDQLNADQRAEAEEIDALRQASADIAARIRAAQQGQTSGTSTVSAAGMVWPAAGPVTSPFGWRWGRMHEGIDIGAGYGSPIHAAAAGTVIYCGWESGYGNFVVIDHGGNVATAYGHQSSIAVACGQHVDQGQTIGYVGSTGHSTGPHLHFEVRVGGNPVDPMGYL